jgi:hypothetical protein
MYLRR